MTTIRVDGSIGATQVGMEIGGVRYVEVEPHAKNSTAIRALSETLGRLAHVAPRGGPPSCDLVVMDGRFFVPDGFAAKACEVQGYVKRVIR